jgi:hypothetical protein
MDSKLVLDLPILFFAVFTWVSIALARNNVSQCAPPVLILNADLKKKIDRLSLVTSSMHPSREEPSSSKSTNRIAQNSSAMASMNQRYF